MHFSFDLNLFIYSINYLSRDFHFAHQGFSNFMCKMYVQFNKREAPFLRVPHTCSGWRNCAPSPPIMEKNKASSSALLSKKGVGREGSIESQQKSDFFCSESLPYI